MSRKGSTPLRLIQVDPKYRDKLVTKFINKMMWDGKKTVAEKILYGAFDVIAAKMKEDPLKVFKQALDNVKPTLEVRSRRVGGATYQVPVEVRPERKLALGMKWIVAHARGRSNKTMRERLAEEFMDAYNGRGGAMKKREDVHKMAEANRAFSHYKW